MNQNSKRQCMLILILIALAILCIIYFKSFKFERYINQNYDIKKTETINITELFTALDSKKYTVTEEDGIIAVSQFLCDITVRRTVFTPSVFHIQPYKSYSIYFVNEDKEVLYIDVNTDMKNMFITTVTSTGKKHYQIINPHDFEYFSKMVTSYTK